MSNRLGGPRDGNCHARSFTVLDDTRDDFRTCDDRDLGVMPWASLISMVEDAGGSRPTFDLFDLPPNLDGTFTRIRAVREGMVP